MRAIVSPCRIIAAPSYPTGAGSSPSICWTAAPPADDNIDALCEAVLRRACLRSERRNALRLLRPTSYGIGLLKAQRFVDLFKLFSAPVNTGRDQGKQIVSHLLLGAWEGMENDAWKLLPGLEQRKTALSDHLHKLFEDWTVDYLFTTGEYTSLFEHFELLGALAYISIANDKATMRAAVEGQNAYRDYVWCPMGRAAWDGHTRRPILEGWKGGRVTCSPCCWRLALHGGTPSTCRWQSRALVGWPAGSAGNHQSSAKIGAGIGATVSIDSRL